MVHSAELRGRVEEMALKLVMDPAVESDPSGWMTFLEQVRQAAVRDNLRLVAGAVDTALEQVRRAGAVASVFQDGIGLIQEALERDGAETPNPAASLAGDPELMSDFVVESREHLGLIEAETLTLEKDPGNSDALHAVFRGFHTIKGLAGFLELADIQKHAHEVETLLDRVRNAELTLSPAAIDLILESADYLKRWVACVDDQLRNRPATVPAEDAGLIERIRAAAAGQEQQPAPATGLEALASAVEASGAPQAAPREAAPPAVAVPARADSIAVRVDTAKLDSLVDMAGELVIAESLVRHDPELVQVKSQSLQRKIAHLTRITAELQKTAMAMRLIPVGPLFRRMARLVRDLSRQFDKRVEMETSGDEIELDRNIVEQLGDPLMHMVRNALDHGIEGPEARQSAGKNAAARLLLRASHQAGQVVVEVSDDGRGLDRERIRAKALERNLIQPDDVLSDSEICNLIFEPGFTTAAQVTNVSGRGVGMDVVRKHVERLRGRIELRSTVGQGTTFLIKLPLTLAIIDGLVVGVGQERYIVPMFAVREMFRPAEDCIWSIQNRAETALVRGMLLPVLRLYRRFGVTPVSEDPKQSVLIVAEAGDRRFCIVVDELIGKQEVVIKSLGDMFNRVEGIAGGAILGDGRVGLILDVERLYKDGTSEPGH